MTYSKTRNAMKDLATNTRDKPIQIFAQVVSQCDNNVQALLPREENPKRTIRLFGRNAYTAVPVTSLNGTRMVYSCLNGCGATEKVPSMKMKKVWALANLSKLSGE
jgi:hypothetical protein